MLGRSERGFTLLEVAIAMLVIGLLLGGILKGQELMSGARARSIIKTLEGMQGAYHGFFDRYRAPPGDYSGAAQSITGVSAVCGEGGNGNGDGRIAAAGGEAILAWDHLSKSGFINGAYSCTGNTAITDTSVPKNAYGQYMQLIHDANYAGAGATDRHNLKTGSHIRADLLGEIDRKIDDGNALTGALRGSTYTTGPATDAACWDAGGTWGSGASNCGAASLY